MVVDGLGDMSTVGAVDAVVRISVSSVGGVGGVVRACVSREFAYNRRYGMRDEVFCWHSNRMPRNSFNVV